MATATCKSCATTVEVEGTSGTCPRCGEALKVDLSVRVYCSCGTTIKAPATMRGRVIRCPKCTKSVPIPKGDEAGQAETANIASHVLRWAFAVALVPLLVSPHRSEKSVREQLDKDIRLLVTDKEDKETAAGATRLKEKVAVLPSKRVASSHLPLGSTSAYTYGALSLAVLLAFGLFAFRAKGSGVLDTAGSALLGVACGAGLGLLLAVLFPDPAELPGPGRAVAIAVVGAVLAEAAKSFAALRILKSGRPTKGSIVTLAGVAAGVGYGAAESVVLALNWLDGTAYPGSYVIAFISMPALHAAWAGLAALLFWRKREALRSDAWFGAWIAGAGGSILLHAVFRWCLATDAQILSLLVGLASFGAFHALHFLTERQEFEESGPSTIQV